MTGKGTVRCVGCGGEVADRDGATHPYMVASPGCWQAYNELIARTVGHGLPHIDAYAAQHPGEAETEPRQRQSVAVHLTALCLGTEFGIDQLDALRSRLSATVLPRLGLSEWPHLVRPPTLGDLTVADLRDVNIPALPTTITAWQDSVWQAWSAQHGTIRTWARAALGAS